MGKAKTAGLRVEPAVFGWLGSDLFLDLCSLAKTVAQIVQLRAANLAVADALDVDDVGSVERENLLAADTIGDAANGDGFFDTAVLLGDDGALEDLDSFAGTFLDFDMNANGVADLTTSAARWRRFSALYICCRSIKMRRCGQPKCAGNWSGPVDPSGRTTCNLPGRRWRSM